MTTLEHALSQLPTLRDKADETIKEGLATDRRWERQQGWQSKPQGMTQHGKPGPGRPPKLKDS
jgi:hypothetical protein